MTKKKDNKKMKDGTLHETLGNSKKENGGEVGPILGIIIVLIVLVSGALYFFFQKIEKIRENGPAESAREILEEKDSITENLKSQSKSDSISAIKKDIEETNLNNIEEGIEHIEKELGIQ